MIYISEQQEQLLKLIMETPDINYAQIAELTEWPINGISERCRALIKKGVIERKGNQRRFTHKAIEDIEYTVTFDGKPPKAEELPDPLMERLKAFKVTDEQRLIINKNRSVSRMELARKLRISKLEVNLALLQMGITVINSTEIILNIILRRDVLCSQI